MNKMQNERNDVEQPCPHCGQDLRLPPDAYERLEAAVELLERNGVHRPDLFPALAAGEGHSPECWKNAAVRELGVGGRLASCTCREKP